MMILDYFLKKFNNMFINVVIFILDTFSFSLINLI